MEVNRNMGKTLTESNPITYIDNPIIFDLESKEQQIQVEHSIDTPVTEGVQQEIDFDNNTFIDETPLLDTIDNPYSRIRKFVSKMERQYKQDEDELKHLKTDNEFLLKEINALQETNKNLLDQLNKANQELSSFNEIKSLIHQFNELKV
jgi:predicted  nucleic acid-binding Zn-ribbon protein